MGTVKTVASDIAKGNEKVEIQAMQLIIGMWAWGFLISPVMSGALAEPIRQYPQWEWLQSNISLTTVLSRHPFLLPNLLGSALCLVAMLAVWLFVPEPVPQEKRRSVKYMLSDFWETCHSWLPVKYSALCTWCRPSYQSVPLHNEIDDCGNAVDLPRKVTKSSPTVVADSSSASIASIFARKQTRNTLLVYWVCSFMG
jgi:MFS family permease